MSWLKRIQRSKKKQEKTPEQCAHDEVIAQVKALEIEIKKYNASYLHEIVLQKRNKMREYFHTHCHNHSFMHRNEMSADDLGRCNDPRLLELQLELVDALREWRLCEGTRSAIQNKIDRLKASLFK